MVVFFVTTIVSEGNFTHGATLRATAGTAVPATTTVAFRVQRLTRFHGMGNHPGTPFGGYLS